MNNFKDFELDVNVTGSDKKNRGSEPASVSPTPWSLAYCTTILTGMCGKPKKTQGCNFTKITKCVGSIPGKEF